MGGCGGQAKTASPGAPLRSKPPADYAGFYIMGGRGVRGPTA